MPPSGWRSPRRSRDHRVRDAGPASSRKPSTAGDQNGRAAIVIARRAARRWVHDGGTVGPPRGLRSRDPARALPGVGGPPAGGSEAAPRAAGVNVAAPATAIAWWPHATAL